MRSEEYRILQGVIRELAAEIKALKLGLDIKIDDMVKSLTDSFKGFGILDPTEDTLTEEQVCVKYNVTRRTMYNHRCNGRIAYSKTGAGRNCKILYRKADVMDLFAEVNA